MQKYKKVTLYIAFFTLIFTAGITNGYATSKNKNKSLNNTHEELLSSFENNDYANWKKKISPKSDIHNIISKNDFNKFVEIRKLARSGQYDKSLKLADALKTDLKEKIDQINI